MERIDRKRLRADTEALAAIAPRIGGTPGEREARAWVEARFREAGLSRVRQERVFYPHWTCQGWSLRLGKEEVEALVLQGFPGDLRLHRSIRHHLNRARAVTPLGDVSKTNDSRRRGRAD